MATTRLAHSIGLLSRSNLASTRALSIPHRRSLSSTARTTRDADLRPPSSQLFSTADVQAGISALASAGYDASTVWEQRVVWGDHDQFQHVNNVHFVRWFESARMFFANQLSQSDEFTDKRREEINRGTGKSFILAGINVRYRRPVVYPDTVSSTPNFLFFDGVMDRAQPPLAFSAPHRICHSPDPRRTGMRTSPGQRQIHPSRRSLQSSPEDNRRSVSAGLRHLRLYKACKVRYPGRHPEGVGKQRFAL